MQTLPITYDPDIEGFVVTSGRHDLVVAPAPGRPIEPISVDAIAGVAGHSIWVAYPSQLDNDQPVHLVIAIVDAKRGRSIAPVLVSEPLSHGIANDQLDVARKAFDPMRELQAGLQFSTER